MTDLEVPSLETPRLFVRPFMMEDLAGAHRLLDVELREVDLGTDKMDALAQRLEWLKWAILNYQQLAILHQPPYGDRAIVLKSNGELIGACGFVPCLNAFEQLPVFSAGDPEGKPSLYTTEFGLFYAISPAYQRQGYATEAAQALVDYAFQKLHLKRIIAETNYDNPGSMGVMRRLGMRIEKNPLPEPPWLQVVGVLENKRIRLVQPGTDFPRILEMVNQVMVEPLTMARFQEWAQLESPGRIFRQMATEDAQGRVIGYSEVVHETWLPAGHFSVWVVVDANRRGQGIGSALYAEALRFLEAQGVTILTSEVRDDDPQALRFAQPRGFAIDRHLFESSLDLRTFDESPFLPVIDELKREGICFFSLADLNDSPEARHRLYELNRTTALDIPGRQQAFRSFEGFEQTVFHAEWYRAEGQLVAAEGETWVGLSAVQLRPETQGAYNLMTGVLRPWRGRNIGLALKLKAILYARQYDAQFIFTHNDSLNAPILRLNQRLGYQPKPGLYTLKKE